MANTFTRLPIDHGDLNIWGPLDKTLSESALSVCSAYLYISANTLYISKGNIGIIDTPSGNTGMGVTEISVAESIAHGATTSIWKRVYMTVAAGSASFAVADMAGETDEEVFPITYTNAYVPEKNGYYVNNNARDIGVVWVDSSGNPTIVATDKQNFRMASHIIARNGDGLCLFDDGGNLGISLEDGGNVGIGLRDPRTLLHIYGSAAILRIQDDDDADSYLNIDDVSQLSARITKNNSSGNAYLHIDPSPDDNASDSFFRLFRYTDTSGSKTFELYKGDNTATVHAQIGVDGEDSYFNSGGNIGIGTSDIEAWSGYSAIEFPVTSIAYHATVGRLFISSNAYYDGNWKYKISDEACQFYLYNDGTFIFRTATSGTIDNAITWVNKLKIDNANDFIGIGGYAGGANRDSEFAFATDTFHFWDESESELLTYIAGAYEFLITTDTIGIGGYAGGSNRDCYFYFATDTYEFWDESESELIFNIAGTNEFKISGNRLDIGSGAGGASRTTAIWFDTTARIQWDSGDERFEMNDPFYVTSAVSPTTFFERTVSADGIAGCVQMHVLKDSNMGDGIGPALIFSIEDDAAVENTIGRIHCQRGGADNTGDMYISAYTAGAPVNNIVIDGSSGNVGVGGTPHSSAQLAVVSTDTGFLPPRMTGAEAEAIAGPQDGLIVYATNAGAGDITGAGWWGYRAGAWRNIE